MDLVLKLKKRLSDAVDQDLGEERVLKIIHKLSQVPMTIDILQSTQIGRDVNALRKHNGRVKTESKALVQTWKKLLPTDSTTEGHKQPSSTVDPIKVTTHISPTHIATSQSSSKHHKKSKTRNHHSKVVDGFSQALLGVPGTECNVDTRPDEDHTAQFSGVPHRIAHKATAQAEPSVKRIVSATHPVNNRIATKARTVSPVPTLRRSVSPNPLSSSRVSSTRGSLEGPAKDSLLTNPRKRKADVAGGLDAVALSKKSRTQVYSGKRSSSGPHFVPSLFDSCIKVLIDSIDLIEEVGGIPFYVLEPVLSRCSATQLMRLEEFNPHFIEDGDNLWEKHCHKEFKGSRPASGQSWRDLYITQLEAQELRLKKLTARISATEKARQEPIRKVMCTNATRKPSRRGARFFPGAKSLDPLESKSKARPLMKQTMKMAQHRNHMMRFKPSQR